jgi:hypothetical protein
MRVFPLFAITLALLATGCASGSRFTFELTVTNNLDVPITAGPIKDGPPYEPNWGTVEQWAIAKPLDALPAWGMVIPPGRTADSGKIQGTFEQGTRGYLRVYAGQHSNAALMAISEGSPSRATVMLFPGPNHFEVAYEGTKIVARRLNPATP